MQPRLILTAAMAAGAAGLWAQTVQQQMMWVSIRQQLLRDPEYFEVVRGSGLPLFEGTVVSMDPPQRPGTLMIGIETPLVAELRLRITRQGEPARMRTTPAKKSKIRFRTAVVEGFTRQPFLLMASIDELDLDFEDVGVVR